MSCPPFAPYMHHAMPPYPMYTQRSLPRHVFANDISQNGTVYVDLNCSSTHPPMYPYMYPYMYPPPMHPQGCMPHGHAPPYCGNMNQHPSFSPVQGTHSSHDDPFAPPTENTDWDCDSLPVDHCENQVLVDLKEEIESLKEQLQAHTQTQTQEQQIVPHHDSHHAHYEPHEHFDEDEEYPEHFLDHYHIRPARITCIYNGATEDTPKEPYILRIPRDKDQHAYVFPKP